MCTGHKLFAELAQVQRCDGTVVCSIPHELGLNLVATVLAKQRFAMEIFTEVLPLVAQHFTGS